MQIQIPYENQVKRKAYHVKPDKSRAANNYRSIHKQLNSRLNGTSSRSSQNFRIFNSARKQEKYIYHILLVAYVVIYIILSNISLREFQLILLIFGQLQLEPKLDFYNHQQTQGRLFKLNLNSS